MKNKFKLLFIVVVFTFCGTAKGEIIPTYSVDSTTIKNLDKLIDENTIVELDKQMGYGESSFNLGGFLLGFFLGLIGVGLAHIFSDDKDFRRSSWKGLGVWVILLLVLTLI